MQPRNIETCPPVCPARRRRDRGFGRRKSNSRPLLRASASGRSAIRADKPTSWSPARCGSRPSMRISRKSSSTSRRQGEFFGFASMLEQTAHQTEAVARRRKRLPGSGPRRYRHSAATQASCRNGHVDRAGPPVSRLAATGAGPRQPQSQRRHRGRHDLRRTHRRPGRQLRRIVDIHHHVRRRHYASTPPSMSSCGRQSHGIPIHSFC